MHAGFGTFSIKSRSFCVTNGKASRFRADTRDASMNIRVPQPPSFTHKAPVPHHAHPPWRSRATSASNRLLHMVCGSAHHQFRDRNGTFNAPRGVSTQGLASNGDHACNLKQALWLEAQLTNMPHKHSPKQHQTKACNVRTIRAATMRWYKRLLGMLHASNMS